MSPTIVNGSFDCTPLIKSTTVRRVTFSSAEMLSGIATVSISPTTNAHGLSLVIPIGTDYAHVFLLSVRKTAGVRTPVHVCLEGAEANARCCCYCRCRSGGCGGQRLGGGGGGGSVNARTFSVQRKRLMLARRTRRACPVRGIAWNIKRVFVWTRFVRVARVPVGSWGCLATAAACSV